MRCQRTLQDSGSATPAGEVRHGNLSHRVDSAIGAPGQDGSDGAAVDRGERTFELALDRALARLHLRTGKIGTVIRDHHAKTGHDVNGGTTGSSPLRIR